MIKTSEQFVLANKAAVDSLLTIANASLANAERLAVLNLNFARAFFADNAAGLGALLAAKDAQSLFSVQSALAKPAVEKATAYSRGVYEILNESAGSLNQIIEGQTAELKKNFSAAVEQSLKNAPAGSESVVAVVQSMLSQADTVYETMTQSVRQVRANIETTMASANAATMKPMVQAA